MPRVTNADAFDIKTEVDTENQQFVITVRFAPDELPYYPIGVASLIAGRTPTTLYKALASGKHGMNGVQVEGVVHVTHESMIKYLVGREVTREATLARRAQTVRKITRSHASSKGPRPPRPVVASHTAQQLLDDGRMAFLDGIIDSD